LVAVAVLGSVVAEEAAEEAAEDADSSLEEGMGSDWEIADLGSAVAADWAAEGCTLREAIAGAPAADSDWVVAAGWGSAVVASWGLAVVEEAGLGSAVEGCTLPAAQAEGAATADWGSVVAVVAGEVRQMELAERCT